MFVFLGFNRCTLFFFVVYRFTVAGRLVTRCLFSYVDVLCFLCKGNASWFTWKSDWWEGDCLLYIPSRCTLHHKR